MSTESTLTRIELASERPDLLPLGEQFCATMMPHIPITTVPLDVMLDALNRPQNPEDLLILVLSADAEGHLDQGSPIVWQLMSAQVPVLVLRKLEWSDVEASTFRRIVVPLDGSATAGQAIPVARRIACMSHLPVHFVMVIDPSRVIPPAYAYDPDAWGMIEELRQTAHWALTQAETTMRNDGVTVDSSLLFGPINASLAASICDGDLVVMTTHGPDRSGLRNQHSVARRVLCSIPQPIFIRQAEPQSALVVDGYQACSWSEPLHHEVSRKG